MNQPRHDRPPHVEELWKDAVAAAAGLAGRIEWVGTLLQLGNAPEDLVQWVIGRLATLSQQVVGLEAELDRYFPWATAERTD